MIGFVKLILQKMDHEKTLAPIQMFEKERAAAVRNTIPFLEPNPADPVSSARIAYSNFLRPELALFFIVTKALKTMD